MLLLLNNKSMAVIFNFKLFIAIAITINLLNFNQETIHSHNQYLPHTNTTPPQKDTSR